MTATRPGLLEFITARLDEDEAAARAAPGNHWRAFGADDVAGASVYDEQWLLLTPARYRHNQPMSGRPGATGPQYVQASRDELAAHIARHDPARALREVEGKRNILARYEDCLARLEDHGYSATASAIQIRDYEDFTLPNLAAAWSDHPDYEPAMASLYYG